MVRYTMADTRACRRAYHFSRLGSTVSNTTVEYEPNSVTKYKWPCCVVDEPPYRRNHVTLEAFLG